MPDSALARKQAETHAATPLDDRVHLRLFGAARLTLPRGEWRAEKLLDRFWRFYLNQNDGATLHFNDETWPLRAGTPYLIPSRVPFSGHNYDADVEHFYIHFDVLGLAEGVQRELFSAPVAVPAQPATRALARAAARSVGAPFSALDFTRQIGLKALLYASLADVLAVAPASQLQRARQLQQAYAPLAPALAFIEENLAVSLPVPHLAALCHLSEDYFIRRFRQSLGQSPVAYIQERRVTLAAQRLLFSSESIEVIAAQCGFGNRFYFSRVFKRHTGVAPAAYRGVPRL
jgi:AraC-like DNA-binding protein